jgi:hypothetical protein
MFSETDYMKFQCLYYSDLAIVRHDQEHPAFKHADYDLSISWVHYFLDIVPSIPFHQT